MADYPNALNAAEDKTASQLETDFLKSARVTIKETDWSKLDQSLLSYEEADKIVEGIAWQDYDPTERLKGLFDVCVVLHSEELARVVGNPGMAPSAFRMVDPNAIKWIEEYGAQDVRHITESQRAAIKAIVKQGYQDGITPQNQARLIRNHIGLDERRSETLRKYGENLFAKGKSEAEIWRLLEIKGKQLLNARAQTIAINEASEAGGRATYASTKDACERGILDPNVWEAYRIITPDERLCSVCNGVAGETRKLPDGVYPSSGSVTAKKHTKCRCVEGLREVTMKKQSIKKRASGEGRANIVFDCQALKRKDGVLYVPTVPMVEGVYEQWGFRVLRSYSEFSQSTNWLHGIPIVVNHEDVTPEARRIGQLFDVQNKPEGRKTTAVSRFYEIDCTQRELEALLSGEPHDGSLRWSCFLEDSPGEWIDPTTGERKQYDVKEVGPYTFVEYSFVKAGVISTKDGAGFNMQCSGCKSNSSAHGAVTGDKTMSSDNTGHEPEVKEQVEGLQKRIETLEANFKTVQEENKGLKQAIEADRKARVFEDFQSRLKPGHQADAEKLFGAYQTNPAAWVMENTDKIVQKVQEKQLRGNALGSGGDIPGVTRPFTPAEMTAEQAKIVGRV